MFTVAELRKYLSKFRDDKEVLMVGYDAGHGYHQIKSVKEKQFPGEYKVVLERND